MRPRTPRIPPLQPDEFTEEQVALSGGRDSRVSKLNMVRVLLRAPDLLRSYQPIAGHTGFRTSLPPRDLEIVIFRVSAVCEADYEPAHREALARKAGLTDSDVQAIEQGGDGLPASDCVLIKAVDELVKDHCLSDASWAALSGHYTEQQLFELVYVVGNYILVALLTNSFGIQSEAEFQYRIGLDGRKAQP